MLRFWWVALAMALSLPTTALAENAPEPEQVFQDWRVLCAPDQPCQMLQSASVGEELTSAFLLSISPSEGQSYAVMTVPLGVYLAPGIEIHVDGRRPFKALYEICDAQVCHAGFKLSGSVLSAFQRGLQAKVRVWTGKTQAVEFPVSLRGFSKAWAHYSKATQEG